MQELASSYIMTHIYFSCFFSISAISFLQMHAIKLQYISICSAFLPIKGPSGHIEFVDFVVH